MNKLDLRMQTENNQYSFLMANLAENTKKRRMQSVRVSLRDSSDRLITLPDALHTKGFCDDRGEFRYLLSIKMERNTLREYPFQIPSHLLEWMEPATRVILRVERLEDDGSVSATGQLDLMAGSDRKLVRYTLDHFMDCLLASKTADGLFQFLQQNASTLGEENTGRVLDKLTFYADADLSGQIEYRLYEFYQSAADEKKAGEWLYKSSQKHFPDAVRTLRELPDAVQAPKAEEFSSMDTCLASAEEGNRDAQYQLYTFYSDNKNAEHDHAAALQWLERAAENGHDGAVEELQRVYLGSFLVDADTDRFLALLNQAASRGSATAYLLLFDAYYSGECLHRPIRQDRRHALECLQSAATAGNVDACYKMWQHFENGNDLLISEQDAAAMLTRAADSGNSDAMNDLGELYVTGRIVNKENDHGVELIRKAAQLGCYGAQMRVFQMWFDGRYYDVLLETDRKKAYQLLLSFAKESANPMAQTLLWQTYTDRNPVMLTRFEALDYLRSAAQQDYLPAMFLMANMELTGIYQDIDEQEGFRLMKRAAKLGSSDAQLALFELYYTGRYYALNSPVNRERAYKWLSRSASSNAQALYEMWVLYRGENEMELEPSDALDMLFSSAGMKCCDALYSVSILFAQGELVPLDLSLALKYLNRAAELGHAKSMYQLYEAYSSGKLEKAAVEPDKALAKRMLLLSAQLNYAPACAEVCRLFESGNDIGVDRTFVGECRQQLPSPPSQAPEK